MKKTFLLVVIFLYQLYSKEVYSPEERYMISLITLVKEDLEENQFKFIDYSKFHKKIKTIFKVDLRSENIALYTGCIINKFPEEGIAKHNTADGADILIVNKNGFVTYSFDLLQLNQLEMESIIRFNKYLFNNDKKQLKWLFKYNNHLLYQLLYYFNYTDDYFLLEEYLDKNNIVKIKENWVWIKKCKKHYSLNDTFPNWHENKAIYDKVELKLNIFNYISKQLRNKKFDSPFENIYLNELYKIEKSIITKKIMTNKEKNKVSMFISKFILKYIKNKNKCFINTLTYKSLYSFCKTTGIKESEIRKLNPWINKKATNIPPNAEIIIPNLKKEENNESK